MPKNLENIGSVLWSREDMKEVIDEFRSIYEQRPIRDNSGGMKAPHLFLTWFILSRLSPDVVIESGVFKGQGTWVIEQACPNAKIHCIDPRLYQIEYRSKHATYHTCDFDLIDFSWANPKSTVCFFDDHQDAFSRVKSMKWKGLTQAIFEDNYPPGQGDCYSLKKVFMEAGHDPDYLGVRGRVKKAILERLQKTGKVPANAENAVELRKNLEIYWEGPPLFKTSRTRWGDPWDDQNYPTTEPLLAENGDDPLYPDAKSYTWMCYIKLKAQPHSNLITGESNKA